MKILASKIYLGNTVIKKIMLDGESVIVTPPSITPVFEVVNTLADISRKYTNVFVKSAGKWYVKNDFNFYEPYGVYDTVVTLEGTEKYEGKLVIFNGVEYQCTGGQWVEKGEVTTNETTLTVPEYLENTSETAGGFEFGSGVWQPDRWCETMVFPYNNGGNIVIGTHYDDDNADLRLFWYENSMCYDINAERDWGWDYETPTGRLYHMKMVNGYVEDLETGQHIAEITPQQEYVMPTNNMVIYTPSDEGRFYYLKMYDGNNELVYDLIPNVVNGVGCLYDFVSQQNIMPSQGSFNVSDSTKQETRTVTTYPVTYAPKGVPEFEITVNTLNELNSYRTPFVGQKAKVLENNKKYEYTADFKWEEVPARGLKFTPSDESSSMHIVNEYQPMMQVSDVNGNIIWQGQDGGIEIGYYIHQGQPFYLTTSINEDDAMNYFWIENYSSSSFTVQGKLAELCAEGTDTNNIDFVSKADPVRGLINGNFTDNGVTYDNTMYSSWNDIYRTEQQEGGDDNDNGNDYRDLPEPPADATPESYRIFGLNFNEDTLEWDCEVVKDDYGTVFFKPFAPDNIGAYSDLQWVKGTISDDTLTVPQNQLIATIDNYECRTCALDYWYLENLGDLHFSINDNGDFINQEVVGFWVLSEGGMADAYDSFEVRKM